MKRPSPFVEHALDLLSALGPVQAKAMFGGWGLYLNGTMFALIADDRMYFKVDHDTENRFVEVDSAPFVYEKQGKAMSMSYWEAPADAMEDPDALLPWAELGFAAAQRAQRAKAKKKTR